jgi:hypothetical protein
VANRSRDWFAQAERDLDQARASERDGRHEWACFAAQQAAEMAVKALHLSLGQEAWGHIVARLLSDLPFAAAERSCRHRHRSSRAVRASQCRLGTLSLPVPAEVLIYTDSEWKALQASASRFAKQLAREVVWVLP